MSDKLLASMEKKRRKLAAYMQSPAAKVKYPSKLRPNAEFVPMTTPPLYDPLPAICYCGEEMGKGLCQSMGVSCVENK